MAWAISKGILKRQIGRLPKHREVGERETGARARARTHSSHFRVRPFPAPSMGWGRSRGRFSRALLPRPREAGEGEGYSETELPCCSNEHALAEFTETRGVHLAHAPSEQPAAHAAAHSRGVAIESLSVSPGPKTPARTEAA